MVTEETNNTTQGWGERQNVRDVVEQRCERCSVGIGVSSRARVEGEGKVIYCMCVCMRARVQDHYKVPEQNVRSKASKQHLNQKRESKDVLKRRKTTKVIAADVISSPAAILWYLFEKEQLLSFDPDGGSWKESHIHSACTIIHLTTLLSMLGAKQNLRKFSLQISLLSFTHAFNSSTLARNCMFNINIIQEFYTQAPPQPES